MNPTEVRPTDLPLSFNQASQLLREWWEMLKAADSSPLHLSLSLRFDGPLDVKVLERVLNEIVRRHDVMRTSFPNPRAFSPADNHALVQRLMRDGILGVLLEEPRLRGRQLSEARVDLSVRSYPPERSDDLTSHVMPALIEDLNRPFQYDIAPLIRATLLTMHPTQHVLIVIMHHLIGDAWSLDLLRTEIECLYERLSGHASRSLPELSLGYGDFARWQRERFGGSQPDEATRYSGDQWAAFGQALVRPDELPFVERRTRNQRTWCAIERLPLGLECLERVRNRCRSNRITAYMFWVAVTVILLHGYTRRESLALYGHCANRVRVGTEHLIGWVENGVILGFEVSSAVTGRAMLEQARRVVMRTTDYQDVPLPVVWKAAESDFGRGTSIVNDRFMSFGVHWSDRRPVSELAGGVTVRKLPITRQAQPGQPSFDIRLTQAGAASELDAKYDVASFEPASVQRILQHAVAIADTLATDPDLPVQDLLAAVPGLRQPVTP